MTMNSDMKHPKPCRLCRHYHGRPHGGVMLVCAMHTYGPQDGQCEDYEKLGPYAPPTSRVLPNQAPLMLGEPCEEAEAIGGVLRRLRVPSALQILQNLVAFLVTP